MRSSEGRLLKKMYASSALSAHADSHISALSMPQQSAVSFACCMHANSGVPAAGHGKSPPWKLLAKPRRSFSADRLCQAYGRSEAFESALQSPESVSEDEHVRPGLQTGYDPHAHHTQGHAHQPARHQQTYSEAVSSSLYQPSAANNYQYSAAAGRPHLPPARPQAGPSSSRPGECHNPGERLVWACKHLEPSHPQDAPVCYPGCTSMLLHPCAWPSNVSGTALAKTTASMLLVRPGLQRGSEILASRCSTGQLLQPCNHSCRIGGRAGQAKLLGGQKAVGRSGRAVRALPPSLHRARSARPPTERPKWLRAWRLEGQQHRQPSAEWHRNSVCPRPGSQVTACLLLHPHAWYSLYCKQSSRLRFRVRQ